MILKHRKGLVSHEERIQHIENNDTGLFNSGEYSDDSQ